MASIQIRNLTKRLGDHLAVRGIDLDITDGELLVIVGPSGCGKTSVLRMVAGLEEPTAGEILMDGAPVTDAHRGRRSVAMMFQEAALYPHLKVRENIGFPLRMAGVADSTIRRQVASVATTLGIHDLLARRPNQLSGGQRQRVAMARSLVRRPELLLMDEPMSNLDAKMRGELRAVIGHLQHDMGITTLYVTHDQLEAMSLGHRVAVMRDGEIVQIGTPDHVYHEPVNTFVATFIGSPAMNLFTGRLELRSSGPTVAVGSMMVPLRPTRWPDLTTRAGHDVIVGVRPHDFRFADTGTVVDVEHIETVADRCIVAATLAAGEVRLTPTGVSLGLGPTGITVDAAVGDDLGADLWQASHVVVEPDAIHLFDPRTGASLRAARSAGCLATQTTLATT